MTQPVCGVTDLSGVATFEAYSLSGNNGVGVGNSKQGGDVLSDWRHHKTRINEARTGFYPHTYYTRKSSVYKYKKQIQSYELLIQAKQLQI